MKTICFDLGMGAAGDMLTAALLELLPDPAAFVEKLNGIGIPGVRYEAVRAEKCGIVGTRSVVTVNGEEEGEHHHHRHGEEEDHREEEPHHHHGSPDEIAHIVRDRLSVPEKIKDDIISVYGLIADAESHVHGVPVTDIHFHEVGTMDALADVAAVCLLMAEIAPERVTASPVHVGSGQVKCAHGILPVPAPATAYILRGVPTYGGSIDGELCTPTGAALLRYFVDSFGDAPVMRAERIGYGMGTKDFPVANCVRATLGECEGSTDEVLELSFNIDDMTAEAIAFAAERIRESGAREVFTVPVGMKKNRPGTLVCAIVDAEKRDGAVKAIFKHTTTLGVRENKMRRYVLDRESETVATEYGDVRIKRSHGYGSDRSKYEYDDVARIALERGVSFTEAEKLIRGEKG